MTPLLRVRNLKKHFAVGGRGFSRGVLRAVDGVSFDIQAGETLGLVGESGCGKSTLGRTILRLTEPSSGEVWFEQRNATALKKRDLLKLRKDMQLVFQDPYASLDPRMTIGATLDEALRIHRIGSDRRARQARIDSLLETVGLTAAHRTRYPHEFSGGQRQRVGIARALAVDPRLIVCDEPVSALDVSVQAQVINLFQDLQQQLGLAYLFIAHDLSVVEHISHRAAVMYLGKIVEIAPVAELYARPVHPYTEALLAAVPVPDPAVRRKRTALAGDLPSPLQTPPGCAFFERCAARQASCRTTPQALREVTSGHFVACQVRAPQ